MATIRGRFAAFLLVAFCAFTSVHARQPIQYSDDEFGPVVRAYLGYLKNEQEVVDDRASRRRSVRPIIVATPTASGPYARWPYAWRARLTTTTCRSWRLFRGRDEPAIWLESTATRASEGAGKCCEIPSVSWEP